MKVFVSRTGGVAGLQLTWQVQVDEQPDAEHWWSLLDSLNWDNIPSGQVSPDRFCYKIRFERHQATIPEDRLDGPWRELVDKVRASQDSTH